MVNKSLNLGKRFRERRLELNWSQAKLAETSGIDASLISRYESGTRRLNETDLWKITGALGLSMEKLFSTDSNVESVPTDSRDIPVIDSVQAGDWSSVQERLTDADFRDTIKGDLDYPPSVFAMRIRGDSMKPDFREGDIVLIAPTIQPRPGDCVVATDENGEATFKRYRELGRNAEGITVFELVPINPDYGTMRSDLQRIAIVGTMIEHRKYRRT